MEPEELIEHVKIGGCLAEDGKQYVELRDALHAVELARNSEKTIISRAQGSALNDLNE